MTNLEQNNGTNNLEIETLKSLALMQYNDEKYFILNDTAYEGTKYDAETDYKKEYGANYENAGMLSDDDIPNFEKWCQENLTEVEPYDEDNNRNDYLVLTDEEADEKAKEYILDSLWAFNASFIAYHTDLDEEVIQAIHDNGKCESNNDTIHNLIKKLGDLDDFVSDAISADGRGHFLSSYDGNENEETVNGTTFYIYRQN
jgi:hypothetical protein